jgi:aminoglycoside phosphotransferase family enzyme/predicted kinase
VEAKILEALRSPACYPERPGEVELVQTHLSVVCLAGGRVYKLKKPVALPFADFRDPDRRKWFCEEEVRLNRRLCPDVYLGVVPLRRLPGGGFRFGGGAGEVIDHAVEMRRLPADGMFDVMLARGVACDRHAESLARRVAEFHAGAARGAEIDRLGSPENLGRFALENFSETRAMAGEVFDETLHRRLEERTRRDLGRLLPALRDRQSAGRVVDGHGDLHARNICFEDGVPLVYDCIEFAPAFRCGDVATENAFLVMDLRYRGSPRLAETFVAEYEGVSGDSGMRLVLPELVRYRAMVRAKVAAFAAADLEISAADRAGATGSARDHLALAAAGAVAGDHPRLALVACGLPASGKSTVFAALARAGGWSVVSTDRVRKELAGVALADPAPELAYTPQFSDRTYREVADRAIAALAYGPVLLDGNFPTPARRAAAVAALTRAGAEVRLVFFDVDGETARLRLAARERDPAAVSDAGWSVYQRLRAAFEPPTVGETAPAVPLLRADAARPAHGLVAAVLAWLLEP